MLLPTIPANTPSPIFKDNLSNALSQPSVASGGEFVVLYSSSQKDSTLLFAKPSSNVSYINDFEPIIGIDSYFDDLVYKASIRDYILPNKSIKIVLSGILSFLKSKKISFKNLYALQEGGVALDFRVNNKKYLVELFNDNEDVFSIQEINQPIKAWDLNHSKLLKMLVSTISNDLRGM
ncbi:hypothetical protein [uncultured Mucilaginibacter sp.]|uniref:hypothetical protein n=1 Tax=uncultured Mucilaginibacter sp. TaxID=797541 RepID=UPI002627B64D|nr:hypothetical protein [uncultured Mucilaginibacter sp.]